MNNKTALEQIQNCFVIGETYLQHVEDFKDIMIGIVNKPQYEDVKYMLFGDICSRVVYFATIDDCKKFSAGLIQQGLVALVMNYLINVRNLIQNYRAAESYRLAFLNSKELSELCKTSE